MNFCPATYLFERDRWYSSYIIRIGDMRHRRMFAAIDKLTHLMSQFIDVYRHIDFMPDGTEVIVDDYLTNIHQEQNITITYFENILTVNPITIDPDAHTDFLDMACKPVTNVPITYLGNIVGTAYSTAFIQNVNYNGNNANKWHMSCEVELNESMTNILLQKQNDGYVAGINLSVTYIQQPLNRGKFILNYRKTTQINELQITFESP